MSDLTQKAAEGYAAELGDTPATKACPHYTSSPLGMAWLVGAWLKATGRPAPRDVRMSRGYTVRANDMLICVRNPDNIQRLA